MTDYIFFFNKKEAVRKVLFKLLKTAFFFIHY